LVVFLHTNNHNKGSKVAEFKYKNLSQEEQDKLDAATFRRLLAHLDENKDACNVYS
jgi:hypothetical protein